ncbi:hypothetical protein OIU34_19270 [Pararhizobium sp. BT-229]|uniref:hypothetical protein n=1 Tax=Pararhizobium sp. BT-229 TaxID=2986923 RepID=UPI0021F74723|nr:hypothetical protein [Pararhizobium sp. BT-229]MCV9964024.1 hypothetical protein [Pararhizobium sp. BT-229]
MLEDEEKIAAAALGETLTSVMLPAYDERRPRRDFLYVWERQGLRWLVRFKNRHPGGSVGNDWMSDFIELNREAILSDDGRMDFNLRAFNARQDAQL